MSQTHRACSVMLLIASLSWLAVIVMLCDDLLVSLLPLSAHLLTEVLFLNFAYLQDSVNTWHMLTVLYSHS
jgi:hypothetical protein